jgi:hypothetical protein
MRKEHDLIRLAHLMRHWSEWRDASPNLPVAARLIVDISVILESWGKGMAFDDIGTSWCWEGRIPALIGQAVTNVEEGVIDPFPLREVIAGFRGYYHDLPSWHVYPPGVQPSAYHGLEEAVRAEWQSRRVPRTELGKTLLELRAEHVASGAHLLDWDEIEEETRQ